MSEPSGQDAAETQSDPRRLLPTADRMSGTPDTDIEEVLRRRVPTRVRIVQTVGLLIVLAVVAGLIVHSGLVAPSRSRAGVATPTPVPLGPILLLSNVSFGTVTLNGVPLAGSPPLVATFRRGMNTLTMTAPLFRPRTCHVQWPSRENDGVCDFPTTVGLLHTVGGRPVSPVLIVNLPFSLEDLPSAAQTRALAAATNALQRVPPQTSVPGGEYIATGQDAHGDIVSQRAGAPLQAKLLAAATGLSYIGDVFCADPGCTPLPAPGDVATPGRLGSQAEWVVVTNMTLHWQFSSSASVVATSAPWSTELPVSLLLTYDAQHGWTVDESGTQQLAGFGLPAALGQTICNVDISVLSGAAQRQGDTIMSPLHDNGLEGCELALQTAQGANAGHFVWRFGVLLAADRPAHTLLPSLPLAPARELAAVGA